MRKTKWLLLRWEKCMQSSFIRLEKCQSYIIQHCALGRKKTLLFRLKTVPLTIYNSLLYKNIQSVECAKNLSGYKTGKFTLQFAGNRELTIIGGLIKRFTNAPKIHYLKSLFLYN